MGKLIDLTGQIFGRLTVIDRSELVDEEGFRAWWNCLCLCGNKREVRGTNLTKKGGTKSCGCLRLEILLHMKNLNLPL